MNPLIPGFGWVSFASLCGGAFALPLRLRRRYQIENTMFVAFFFATLVIPLIVAHFLLPQWYQALADTPAKTILIVMAFGFAWGTGSVFLAHAVNSIGLSLAYAVIMGLNTTVGSVIPMLRPEKWNAIPSASKTFTFLGIVICVIGVAICGRAGLLREKSLPSASPDPAAKTNRSRFLLGLLSCLVAGFVCAGANLGYEWAEPIAANAAQLGADPRLATLSRWLTMYWGGYVAIVLVFGITLLRKKTYRNFTGPGASRDFLLALLMSALHFLGQIPYGVGAYYLGRLGTTVGWAVYISAVIVIANLLGFITGEWKSAPKSSRNTLYLGLLVLIASMSCLAYANSKL